MSLLAKKREPAPAVYDQDAEPDTEALADTADVFDEPEHPEGLPGNFKTTDALVRSYKHAERKIHEQARVIVELRARLEEVEPSDPEAMRAVFAEHRQTFFAQMRAEAERLLALEGRLAVAELAALQVLNEESES